MRYMGAYPGVGACPGYYGSSNFTKPSYLHNSTENCIQYTFCLYNVHEHNNNYSKRVTSLTVNMQYYQLAMNAFSTYTRW